jgi:hypothetical protein
MRYGNVIKHQSEFECSCSQVFSYHSRDLENVRVRLILYTSLKVASGYKKTNLFSLRNELAGVKLSDDALEDLVYYRGQHTFIEVTPKLTINEW